MPVKFSASCADRALPRGRFLVLNSITGWVDTRAKVCRLESPLDSNGIEPIAFRHVAQRLKQLRYSVPLRAINIVQLAQRRTLSGPAWSNVTVNYLYLTADCSIPRRKLQEIENGWLDPWPLSHEMGASIEQILTDIRKAATTKISLVQPL
jgi:hypothetical protein